MNMRTPGLAIVATMCMAAFGAAAGQAGEGPSECLVTLKTYIISGSPGKEGVSFPVYPGASLTELEEAISGLDAYYEKLRSLYAFTEYRLVTITSEQVRLAGYPHPTTTMVNKASTQPPTEWSVEARDFGWDAEGRLQMLLRITRGAKPFIESRICVIPGRSVVLGSFADQKMKEAIFAVVVPDIDVSAVGDGLSAPTVSGPGTEPAGKAAKIGLPPAAEPECAGSAKVQPNPLAGKPFVEAAEYPIQLAETPPEYPKAAMQERAEGSVWLRSLIDENGGVSQCVILRSSGRADLDSAAVRSGRISTYKPARDKYDKPISCWVAYKVVFALK